MLGQRADSEGYTADKSSREFSAPAQAYYVTGASTSGRPRIKAEPAVDVGELDPDSSQVARQAYVAGGGELKLSVSLLVH